MLSIRAWLLMLSIRAWLLMLSIRAWLAAIHLLSIRVLVTCANVYHVPRCPHASKRVRTGVKTHYANTRREHTKRCKARVVSLELTLHAFLVCLPVLHLTLHAFLVCLPVLYLRIYAPTHLCTYVVLVGFTV